MLSFIGSMKTYSGKYVFTTFSWKNKLNDGDGHFYRISASETLSIRFKRSYDFLNIKCVFQIHLTNVCLIIFTQMIQEWKVIMIISTKCIFDIGHFESHRLIFSHKVMLSARLLDFYSTFQICIVIWVWW